MLAYIPLVLAISLGMLFGKGREKVYYGIAGGVGAIIIVYLLKGFGVYLDILTTLGIHIIASLCSCFILRQFFRRNKG